MRSTILNRHQDADLGDSECIVIDVCGGPGVVALIVGNVIQESLRSVRVAEVLSPRFPQVTLISNDGVAAPPRIDINVARFPDGSSRALILLSRNFIVDEVEVGEEAADLIMSYLSGLRVSEEIFITSGRISTSGEVYVSSTELERVRRFVRLGAKTSSNLENLPVDRVATSLMLRSHLRSIPMSLIISDTMGFAPDLASAKRVITILSTYLNVAIDTTKLDMEIEKQRQVFEETSRLFQQLERGGGSPTYIG
jgi:predicted ATP-grasp superfamily ATP-dependent carboligase